MFSPMELASLSDMDKIFLHSVFDDSEMGDSVDEYPKVMDSNCHAASILSELEKDRKGEQEFCDATISTESRNFVIHKCVVAAASIFFRKLFSSKMKENYESKATIKTVSPEIMATILDYIYTSNLEITDENVYDLLCASDYLQMQEIKDMCGFYLKDNLSEKNCFGMWNFAKMYNMKNLTFLTEMYISANFIELLKRELYRELSVNNFKDYLALRNSTASEIDIYKAIIIWAQNDLSNREEYIQELFSRVNLTKIPRDYLISNISKEPLLYSSPTCVKFIIKALCEEIEELEKPLVRQLFVLGGTPSERDFLKLDLKTKKWMPGPNMPFGRSGASAVIVNDQLYVIGGNCWSVDTSKSFNTFISFDLKNHAGTWKVWEQTMKKYRRCAGCAVLDGYIYMCGGKAHNTMWLSACERFDVASQVWFSINDMHHKRSEFGLVALQGKLYALGGFERPNSFLNSVEIFDPSLGTWIESAQMKTHRARFAAAVHKDEIYVVGGETELGHSSSVEKYSPCTGTWTYIASMSEARFNHSVCVVGNEIFAFGGNTKLEAYDCKNDEWNVKMVVTRKLGCALVAFEKYSK